MEGRLLLDNRTLAFKARLLFTEATLEDGVSGEDYVVFLQFLGVSHPRGAMPDKYIHAIRMSIDLITPLHNCNRGTTKQVRLKISNTVRDRIKMKRTPQPNWASRSPTPLERSSGSSYPSYSVPLLGYATNLLICQLTPSRPITVWVSKRTQFIGAMTDRQETTSVLTKLLLTHPEERFLLEWQECYFECRRLLRLLGLHNSNSCFDVTPCIAKFRVMPM